MLRPREANAEIHRSTTAKNINERIFQPNPLRNTSDAAKELHISISFFGTQYLDRIDGVIDYTVGENFTETDAGTDFSGRGFSDIPLCGF